MFVFAAFVFRRSFVVTLLAVGFIVVPCAGALAPTDPLPSWNDGAVKKSITDFVSRVTTQGVADFVSVAPSKIGKLDKAWDEAGERGWLVVDMKRDWKTIFLFEK